MDRGKKSDEHDEVVVSFQYELLGEKVLAVNNRIRSL